ncbi:MAG: MazG nucleotide pyrophosphohydrolase domain-containing protein [Aliarcobacter butzleri]|nr:MazG nucleotide pyrophosphohydrolase domain-containing protein [Aliarcobacter butzleri]
MFDGRLNEFCKINNVNVRAKGFWDDMHNSIKHLEENKAGETLISATKNAFISQKLDLIHSELGEATEAMRKQKYGLEKKDTFEDEIADVMIRLCDLCGELGIDIEKQIEWKFNHNKTRENKHGKSF